jgi:hypothetical protein
MVAQAARAGEAPFMRGAAGSPDPELVLCTTHDQTLPTRTSDLISVANDDVEPDVAGERLRRAFDSGLFGLNLHVDDALP